MKDADYTNMMRVLQSIEAHLKRLNDQMGTLMVVTQEAGRVASGLPAQFGVATPIIIRHDDDLRNSTNK